MGTRRLPESRLQTLIPDTPTKGCRWGCGGRSAAWQSPLPAARRSWRCHLRALLGATVPQFPEGAGPQT